MKRTEDVPYQEGYLRVEINGDPLTARSAIILCHGLGGDRNWKFFPFLANSLEDAYLVVRFDFPGSGETTVGQYNLSYRIDVEALEFIANYVKNDYDLDVSVLVGHSKGGNVVMMYPSRNLGSQLRLVINLSGRFFMQRFPKNRYSAEQYAQLERDGYFHYYPKYLKDNRSVIITKEMMEERANLDMAKYSAEIPKEIRVLGFHGRKDDVIPEEDATEGFVRSCNHYELRLIETDHFYSGVGEEMVNSISHEIRETVQ